MAKFEQTLKGNFDEILARLDRDILASALSMKLVDESNFSSGDFQLAVRVYDKYFARNSSRASLSLVLAGHGDDILVTAIGAGGGQGLLFNLTWGAEEELVETVRRSLGNGRL